MIKVSKVLMCLVVLMVSVFVVGCSAQKTSKVNETGEINETSKENETIEETNDANKINNANDVNEKKGQVTYEQISPDEAKNLMDTEKGYVIIDARTQEEYDEGHIEGAILIPEYEIKERAETELPDKEQLILVYCRSGRRSKIASQYLVDLG